jgi:ribosome modulation factor
MKKQKRNLQERAYQRGYSAGLSGRNRDNCPHGEGHMRSQWLSGWHEGRHDNWDGFGVVSGIQKMALRWRRIHDSSTRSARRTAGSFFQSGFFLAGIATRLAKFSVNQTVAACTCGIASVDWRSALIPTINPIKTRRTSWRKAIWYWAPSFFAWVWRPAAKKKKLPLRHRLRNKPLRLLLLKLLRLPRRTPPLRLTLQPLQKPHRLKVLPPQKRRHPHPLNSNNSPTTRSCQ